MDRPRMLFSPDPYITTREPLHVPRSASFIQRCLRVDSRQLTTMRTKNIFLWEEIRVPAGIQDYL